MSSETAVARSYLDDGERDAPRLAYNFVGCSFYVSIRVPRVDLPL